MANKSKTKNTVAGVIILVVIVLIAIFSVVVLGQWAWELFEKLSKLDAVVIVALITGAISIIVAVISKVIDHNNSRKEYLAQKREVPYEAFIAMVYKVQENTKKPNSYTEEEMITDIKAFSEALTLWGSKNVAEKWVKFRLNGGKTGSTENILIILEDILNEMRADMGVKKLKKGTLLSFFVNDIDKNMQKK
jgi:hypothetical protein